MYDPITLALLFGILSPGGMMNVLIRVAVFYVIVRFLATYIPWWVVWVGFAVSLMTKG